MNIKKATDSPRVDESAETKTLGQVIAALSRQLNAEEDRCRTASRVSPDYGRQSSASVLETVPGGRTRRMAGT